jgi:uncharacterized protein
MALVQGHGRRRVPRVTVRFELDESGQLGAWQRLNRTATIPHCIEQLEASGTLDNVRRLAGRSSLPYRGQRFADSDIYKTLEAVAWSLEREDDPNFRDFFASTTRLLASAQEPDGYLNSWFQREPGLPRFGDLPWGHEMYCAGHLVQAAVAASRSFGDVELLAVARRFADLLVRTFGPGGRPGVCGHPEIEMALVDLYRLTGQRDYLDLAARMIDLRGHGLLGTTEFGREYFQDHAPVREATEAVGHAVRQLYLACGATDVYLETGDRSLLAAMERLWDDVYTRKAYITGGVGSRHRDEAFGAAFELPSDTAYAETCAAIAGFMWNWRLLRATGRGRYADMMERILFNAVACGVSTDGRRFFYVNPLEARGGDAVRRQPWFDCACCPPNLARLVASLQHHVASDDERGVFIHLYTPGRLRASGPYGDLELSISTAYPSDGRVRVEVLGGEGRWALGLRIPDWCRNAMVMSSRALPDANGYVRLDRRWSDGDAVEVDFAMPVRTETADPRVEAVRGRVARMRGPIVYCSEGRDEIPYHEWANRGPLPMQVWLPAET